MLFSKGKKFIASMLVLATVFTSAGIPAFASAKNYEQVTTTTPAPITTTQLQTTDAVYEVPPVDTLGDRDPQYGPRTYLLRLALETVAVGVRYGGSLMGTILAELSPTAGYALKRNASAVANRLDYISTWTTLAEESIRMNLYNFLRGRGVNSQDAMEIASVLASIVSALAL